MLHSPIIPSTLNIEQSNVLFNAQFITTENLLVGADDDELALSIIGMQAEVIGEAIHSIVLHKWNKETKSWDLYEVK